LHVAAACLLTLCLAVSCSFGETELEWKEDVELQDGRVITIQRRSEFRGGREAFTQRGANVSRYSVDFVHPVTGEKVHWESKVSVGTDEVVKAAAEKQEIMPSLDLWRILLKDRDLYLVVFPHASHSVLNCPDPPYLLYRRDAGRWRLTPLEQIPYRKFKVNVSLDDDEMRERIRRNKYHIGVEVTGGQTSFGSLLVIDLSRMTRQTADRKHCEFVRYWTNREAVSN
jgi:hypothetical protein